MDNITWKTYEHIHTEKTSDWYWIVGIVTLTLAIIAVFLNNVIFAVLIIVGSFSLSLFASKKPAIVDVTVSDTGIAVGKIFHSYGEIESFWVETRDAYPRLVIKTKKVFVPFTTILLSDTNPDNLQFYLRKKIKMEEHIEPFFEKLLIYLGF